MRCAALAPLVLAATLTTLGARAPAARAQAAPLPPLPAAALPAPGVPPPPERPELPPLQVAAYTYLLGVGVAAATVPSMMAIGTQIGKSSPDLPTAAVPSLLLMALVPPLCVAGSEWLLGRRLAPGMRFHPAVWAGLGINVVAMVAGTLAGVWTRNAASLSAFTIADALVMPAGVTLVMHYTRKRPRVRLEWR